MFDPIGARKLCLNGKSRDFTGSADYDRFPLLSTFMAGKLQSDGVTFDVPPHKLTLYLEPNCCKIRLGVSDQLPTFWSTMESIGAGLEAVELALSTGRGEWVPPKGEKRVYTR